MRAQAFYPVDGEFPEIDKPVDVFWDDDDFGTAKVLLDDDGEPLWFRLDNGEWVLTDDPVFWIAQTQAFYPIHGEYPDADELVNALWNGDISGTAKVVPDGEGKPLWFRLDDGEWVLTDAPLSWSKGKSNAYTLV